MAWHRPGAKPLSELMMVSLPTCIRVTRPQWVNLLKLVTPYGVRHLGQHFQTVTPLVAGAMWVIGHVFLVAISGTTPLIPTHSFSHHAATNLKIRFPQIASTRTWSQMSGSDSLWPNYAIWRHRSGSTLVQVMAFCPTAPSHYLNQCWLTITKIQFYSSDGNFTRDTSVIDDKN